MRKASHNTKKASATQIEAPDISKDRKSMKNRLHWVLPLLLTLIEIALLTRILIPAGFSYNSFNLLLFFPLVAVLIILPLNWYAISVVSAVFLYGVHYLNEFLISARGRPIHYIDYYCVKDALRVSSNYQLVFNWELLRLLVLTVGIVIIFCYAIYKIKPEKPQGFRQKLRKPVCGAVLLCLSLIADFRLSALVDKMDWYENRYMKEKGIFFTVYSEYINSKPQLPVGYQRGLSEQILSSYTDQPVAVSADMPDEIYVIMNEAFADYSLLGESKLAEDPLSKFHSLEGSACFGKCAVNVYGGNTCNSEFEFLTGDSLLFMPPDTVPYMTYVLEGHPSIAQEMNALSYATTAIHPYFGQEWKRSTIYPQFGFSSFVSGELFSERYIADSSANLFEDINNNRILPFGDDLEYVRGFISDAECYRKLRQITSDRDFVFAVTVQNHGGYEKLKPSDVEHVTDDRIMNEYLHLIKISDKAFSDFIGQLKESDKKTVVLMFGDHQPGIETDCVFKSRFSDQGNRVQKIADNYIVPYVLWANYDIEWDAPEFTSLNYLSAILKKNCSLPLTKFDQFRLDCMEQYPVISSRFCVDAEGNYVSGQNAMESDALREYAIVQYDRLSQ